jgi:RNA-splicing ligase RtcB
MAKSAEFKFHGVSNDEVLVVGVEEADKDLFQKIAGQANRATPIQHQEEFLQTSIAGERRVSPVSVALKVNGEITAEIDMQSYKDIEEVVEYVRLWFAAKLPKILDKKRPRVDRGKRS